MDMHTDPQYKSDDGNALRIWRDAAENAFLSEKFGRPIFDEVIYVEVIAPGSGNSTPVFEVKRVLAKEAERTDPKYGPKYAEFKKFILDFETEDSGDGSLAGTPLSQWPEVKRTMAAALKAQKIFTVEALANLPDSKLHVVGPDGRAWRDKAAAYLETAKGNAQSTQLAAMLADRDRELADMRQQMQNMSAQMTAMQEAQNAAVNTPPSKRSGKAEVPQEPPTLPPALDASASDVQLAGSTNSMPII